MSVLSRVRFEPYNENSIYGKVFVNGQHIENVSQINFTASATCVPEVTLTVNGKYDLDQLVALDVEVPAENEDEILKGLRFMSALNEGFREHLISRIEEALIDGKGLDSSEQAEMILDYMTEE